MQITLGVDIGQKHTASAICVAEGELRNGSTLHYLVRHLDRLPIGAPFPEVAKRTAEIAEGIRRRSGALPRIFINVTGLGEPLTNLFHEYFSTGRVVTPVQFTYGDRRIVAGTAWKPEIRLGKAFLVSRLQTLLQTNRLHLPKVAGAETLAQELSDFEVHIEQDANERYGAFRVGTQDDLVNALGLSVQTDQLAPSCGAFFQVPGW